MKKFVVPFLIGTFVLAILFGQGCGGGGGGSSTTTTTSTTSGTNGLSNIRAEAALSATPDSPIDPLNIQAGDAVNFEVAGYDKNSVRHILASTNWTTSDNGNQSGQLLADGSFTATASSGVVIYTATGTAQGKQYQVSYRVKPFQAIVTGSIMDNNGAPAQNISIEFFNVGGAVVSSARSQFDGSFRASVPTTAKTFNLDKTTISPQLYYQSFSYQSVRYTTLISTCNASLPALTNGTTTSIGLVTLDATMTGQIVNPPPPPPDGCS